MPPANPVLRSKSETVSPPAVIWQTWPIQPIAEAAKGEGGCGLLVLELVVLPAYSAKGYFVLLSDLHNKALLVVAGDTDSK